MRKSTKSAKTSLPADFFINIPVSKATRDGLQTLKASMGVSSQAEVVEKLVAIGLAIDKATR